MRNLKEHINEARNVQVKRKYGQYDSVNVGANAPIRNTILGFINSKGSCTKQELSEFISSNNEENGGNTSNKWVSRNKKYLQHYTKDGQQCCKLSKLGQRVVNKTTINEAMKLSPKERYGGIGSMVGISAKVIQQFIEENNLNADEIFSYAVNNVKERVNTGMIIAGFADKKEIDSFIETFSS